MPRRGRSNEDVIHALHQVEGGEKVTEVCRRLGVSEQTFYRWKKQFSLVGSTAPAISFAVATGARNRQVFPSRSNLTGRRNSDPAATDPLSSPRQSETAC